MMQVDPKQCTGCGECLTACTVEAITMLDGRAVIDLETCFSCGSCTTTCPVGAISEVNLPVPTTATVLRHPEIQKADPVVLSPKENRFAWIRPVFSFVGTQIVPRLVDTIIIALDRRLLVPSEPRVSSNFIRTRQSGGRQRQQRCRRRGKKFG